MVSAKLLVVALVFRFLEDLDFFFLDGIVNNRGCDGARSWTRGGGEKEHGLLGCVVASGEGGELFLLRFLSRILGGHCSVGLR